jgi:hypothetical protein
MALPILPIVMLAGLGYAGFKLAGIGERRTFNKGVCLKCGGHFKYIPETEDKGSRGYKCDVCDNCVWISFGSDSGYSYTKSKLNRKMS